MKTPLYLATLLLAATLGAAPLSFDFKDPKGLNAIQFSLDSLLEPIGGTANGLTGLVSYDPADPAATNGKITVSTASLVLPNPTQNKHLLSDAWLDAAANPEITFELVKLTHPQTTGATTTAEATGKFTLKGVTKDITVPVKITYLPDALEKRTKPGNKGDLLVVRGEFTLQRADYGIQPGKNEDRVANEIKLTIAIVGTAPKS